MEKRDDFMLLDHLIRIGMEDGFAIVSTFECQKEGIVKDLIAFIEGNDSVTVNDVEIWLYGDETHERHLPRQPYEDDYDDDDDE